MRQPATAGAVGAVQSSSTSAARVAWTVAFLKRGVSTSAPLPLRAATLAGIVIGAATVAVSAVIHLHLWLQGYKHIHTIGPLFLAQAVGGIALAIVMVLYRRLVTVIAGAGYMASTVIGLLISATVGIFGFHDGLDVPWATSSLVIELIGFVVLVAAGAVIVARR
jgi:hypothetical protein